MYQVIEIYGYTEPWWLLEDWKDDIIGQQAFETFEEALAVYRTKWQRLKQAHPSFRSKASLLAAFWDETNQTYCEDCGEELQEYASLALLKDWEELSANYHLTEFDQGEDAVLKKCALKKIG